MLFSSPAFFVFFAFYFILHVLVPRRYRNYLIIAGSTVVGDRVMMGGQVGVADASLTGRGRSGGASTVASNASAACRVRIDVSDTGSITPHRERLAHRQPDGDASWTNLTRSGSRESRSSRGWRGSRKAQPPGDPCRPDRNTALRAFDRRGCDRLDGGQDEQDADQDHPGDSDPSDDVGLAAEVPASS